MNLYIYHVCLALQSRARLDELYPAVVAQGIMGDAVTKTEYKNVE